MIVITEEQYKKVMNLYKRYKKKFIEMEDVYLSHMRECCEKEEHIKYLKWKIKDLEEKLNNGR